MNKEKNSWSYEFHNYPIGDTGDYDSFIIFTNGEKTIQTNSDDIENEECEQLCELLNLIPDLFSHEIEDLKIALYLNEKITKHYKNALTKIRDSEFEGLTKDEKIEDIKAIAFNSLWEVENGLI